MDPSAPQTVLKGVAITSILCGAAAGLHGSFKHSTPGKFLVYSAVNGGIVAATFFSIREYLVSPILVFTLPGREYQLRRQRLFHLVHNNDSTLMEPTALSWTDFRVSCLLDSGISGGLAGGALNAWKRGARGLVPGFTTGALMCTLLQWAFNEFNILRIQFVSATSTAPAQLVTRSSRLEQSTPVAMSSAPTHSLADRIFSMLGQRISDKKYLERLRMERNSYLRRIAELEERKKE